VVVSFGEYRSPAHAGTLFGECHARCGRAFATQRAAIQAIVETLQPRVAAALLSRAAFLALYPVRLSAGQPAQ
jgi:hypothetical protein